MLVKRNHGSNKWIICIIFVIAFYYTLRVSSLVEMNGEFKMEYLTEALDKLHILTTPLILNLKTLTTSLFVGLFVLMIIYTYMTQNKKIYRKIHMVVLNGKNLKTLWNLGIKI